MESVIVLDGASVARIIRYCRAGTSYVRSSKNKGQKKKAATDIPPGFGDTHRQQKQYATHCGKPSGESQKNRLIPSGRVQSRGARADHVL